MLPQLLQADQVSFMSQPADVDVVSCDARAVTEPDRDGLHIDTGINPVCGSCVTQVMNAVAGEAFPFKSSFEVRSAQLFACRRAEKVLI